MDKLTLPAKLDSLNTLLSFVLDRAERVGASDSLLFDIRLALEEVLTNIFFYAYPDRDGEVDLSFSAQTDGTLTIEAADRGLPFDPVAAAAPDLEGEFSEREIGGLGIYLARKVAHSLTYRRDGDFNHLTLCFHVEQG